jgi:hypothetical protein
MKMQPILNLFAPVGEAAARPLAALAMRRGFALSALEATQPQPTARRERDHGFWLLMWMDDMWRRIQAPQPA